MRRLIAGLVALVVLAAPQPADAWGFEAHKYILDRAISLLPPEIRPFFEKYRASIVEHAIDPDLWRNVGFDAVESPRHFVDMDAYGPPPFKAAAARLRRGGETLRAGVRQQERPAAVARAGDPA